jgi:hypothetical protein
MAMGVDETWQENPVTQVGHLCTTFAQVIPTPDLRDTIAVDQYGSIVERRLSHWKNQPSSQQQHAG